MLIELIARLSPKEILNLEGKLRAIRELHEKGAGTKMMLVTESLKAEMLADGVDPRDNFSDGYNKAISDVQDALRKHLISPIIGLA